MKIKREDGFSLVELMTVVAIIGVRSMPRTMTCCNKFGMSIRAKRGMESERVAGVS